MMANYIKQTIIYLAISLGMAIIVTLVLPDREYGGGPTLLEVIGTLISLASFIAGVMTFIVGHIEVKVNK